MSAAAEPHISRPAADDQAAVLPRYKRTEVGVIPEDWVCEQLGKHCERITKGTTPTSVGRTFTAGGIHFIKAETINEDGRTIPDKLAFIDTSTHTLLARSQLAVGDILISIAGVLGRVGRVELNDLPANINQALAIVRIGRHSSLERDFLFWCLRSDMVEKQIRDINVQAAQANISLQNVRDFILPLPPSLEQRAIAEALSDVDGLLGALEALIAKKRAIKQAAMQQLLTGNTRLPGFSGPWETKRLGEIAELHRQNIVPAAIGDALYTHFSLPAFDDGQAPVIEAGNAIGSNKFRVPASAVLVSKLNPRIPRVWMPHEGVPNAVASTEFLVLTPRQGTSRIFLFVLCSSPEFCDRLELSATGTTGSHQRVTPSDAMKISLRVPPHANEQTAIATVLSDMDAEIAALERRAAKTRAIKQGMMQQLLTGRVRLVGSS
ncbi:MAG: restriction endonuclease subunit S [Gemmatimonadales bacterium]|nr:restriction endonuclease subunit S [Gemmatimonadales bacterium]